MARQSSAARAAQQDDSDGLDFSERAGFLTGKAAAMADWAFRKENAGFKELCARLYQRNWARLERQRDPERVRGRLRAWRAANRDRVNEQARQRLRLRWRAPVLTCVECGARWCPIRGAGRTARYCSSRCRGARIWKARAKARNRGIRNMGIRTQIVSALGAGPKTLRQIVEATGAKYGSVATTLCEMAKAGTVRRDGRRYEVTK